VTLFKRHATVTGAGSERQSSPRKTSQPITGKRKAEESTSSDGLTTPAAKRPAPDPLVSETPGTSGEHKPERSRQQAAIEGKPEYAAVVAGHTNHQQPSRQPKPKANGLEPSKPAVSPDAATRRMSCEDMSGPLCSMELTPPRLRPSPAGERPNKTSSQESLKHVIFSRGYGRYVLSARMKSEKLMIVPGTSDGIRATISALRSLDVSKDVSFHTISLPEDRCVRLLIKKLGRRMPESIVREKLEALGIGLQAVLQLRPGRRDQDATKNRPPTPHFVVLVARGPDVQKVRSLSELCGLRVSVETYIAPKAPLQCKRCQRLGYTQRNCGYTPRCVACGEPHSSGECSTPRQQLKCSSCTTQQTNGAVQSGRKSNPRLQSGRQLLASTRTVQPAARLQRKRPALSLLRSRRAYALNGPMWYEGGR
jgi:hypothetical protein